MFNKKEIVDKLDKKQSTAVFQDVQRGLHSDKSDFKEAVEILMNNNYKRRKTILDNRQVFTLSVLDVISQLYDIPFLKDWIGYYAEWRTSGDNGKGRQDIVDIAKSHILVEQQEKQSFLGNLRGRR